MVYFDFIGAGRIAEDFDFKADEILTRFVLLSTKTQATGFVDQASLGQLESQRQLLIGKLITSITMTVFYVILYHVWRKRYRIDGHRILTQAVYLLAAIRIALCLFPQNAWTSANAPLNWAIYRNIPFAFLGLLMIFLFMQSSKANKDASFRFL